MDIVIATNNKDKVKEYKKILSGFDINLYTLKDLNIECDPEENGTTFQENALIKAQTIAQFTDKVVIADDSGLVVDAFPELLGIYSHRFFGDTTYPEKCHEVIRLLSDKENRNARFVCCIAVVNLTNKPLFFEGVIEGSIGYEHIGNNGFGYDPIFIPNGYNITTAQMTDEEKNAISHRGIAGRKMADYLKEFVK